MENETDACVAESGQCLVLQSGEFNIIYDHAAAVRAVQSGQDVEQGGFPRTRRPHDGDHLTGREADVHAAQDLQIAVGLVDAGRLEHVRKLSLKPNFAAPFGA